jgi:biotin operon repressor
MSQLAIPFQRYAYTQADFIRGVLMHADEQGAWLTLAELAHLTNYGEASISAQMRNLRKDGFHVSKRIRSGMTWEYRIGIHPFVRTNGQ